MNETRFMNLFTSIGLSQSKAAETLKNKSLSTKLASLIERMKQISNSAQLTKSVGSFVYILATTHIADAKKLDIVMRYVADGKISSNIQLRAAIEYFKNNINITADCIDMGHFESATGVGVVVSDEQIVDAFDKILLEDKSLKSQIVNQRESFNTNRIVGMIMNKLKWCPFEAVKKIVDEKIVLILKQNPASTLTVSKKSSFSGKAAANSAEVNYVDSSFANSSNKSVRITNIDQLLDAIDPKKVYKQGEAGKFHKPGHNYETPLYIVNEKTKTLLAEHLERIKLTKYNDQEQEVSYYPVRTRFPPEPNGILHIGHAKAINFNFGYALANAPERVPPSQPRSITFLRYDDTNPSKEEHRFFIGIQDMVRWLGFTPYQITYASDHFERLYNIAELLIKKDLAYVCHQKQTDIQGFNVEHSPYRGRPNTESLQLFRDMRAGKFEEGEATLRLKYVMEDGKVDPVAYRIKYEPHVRTGDAWCIYPTYDYTHPLCDSIEDITHSLCTKEFQSHRPLYYWLCDAADMYCPVQWEYGRLNLNYTVVSKRKIGKLIEAGKISDWDDPRLYTLSGLRRRGVPYEAINLFCAKVGVTMADATINPEMLNSFVRDVLNITATRTMAVLDPIEVEVVNFDEEIEVSVALNPVASNSEIRTVKFQKSFYIDQSDFKFTANPSEDYRRLTCEQPVGLKHAGLVIYYKSHELFEDDKNKKKLKLFVEARKVESTLKPASFIQWVNKAESERVEVRLYGHLFKSPNPEDPNLVPGGFLSDVNDASLVVKEGIVEKYVVSESVKEGRVSEYKSFQFERLGYFSVDPDSTADRLVFNRTVTLK